MRRNIFAWLIFLFALSPGLEQSRGVKRFALSILAVFTLADCSGKYEACTGKANCTVCHNCSRCRHCHIEGGSCGVKARLGR